MISDRGEARSSKQVAFATIVGCLIVGAVLGVGIVLGFEKGSDLRAVDWFNGASSIATVAALAAAVAVAVYTGQQLLENKRTTLLDRSIAVNERLSSWEFSEHMQVAAACARLKEGETEDLKWEAFNDDRAREKRRHFMIVVNTFDELGLRFEKGLVDQKLIRDFVSFASLQTYGDLVWLVTRHRDAYPEWQGPTSWEAMNKDLTKARKALGLKVPHANDD